MSSVLVGTRVVCGQCRSAQDDGVRAGTVVEYFSAGGTEQESTSSSVGTESKPGRVLVQWDVGGQATYTCGAQEEFELRILDTAPAGVEHVSFNCSGCGERNIVGLLWKCTPCDGVYLCSTCYHGNEHNTDHKFCVVSSPGGHVTFAPQRAISKQSEVRGFFPKALVVRVDKCTDTGDLVECEDGGSGVIVALCDSIDGNLRTSGSLAVVKHSDGAKQRYNVGHCGKIDLKCTSPATGGEYYVEHLPILGLGIGSRQPSVAQQGEGRHEHSSLKADNILSRDALSPVRHQGISDSAASQAEAFQDLGKTKSPLDNTLRHHSNTENASGQTSDDFNDLSRVSGGQGQQDVDYNIPPGINSRNGARDNLMQSATVGQELHIAPILRAISGFDHSRLESLLGIHRNLINNPFGERQLLFIHYATAAGNVRAIRLLVKYGSVVDCQDNLGVTPLHAACHKSDAAAVSCLVELGASVNLLNGDMQNPLHAACYKGSVLCATILIDRAEQLNIPADQFLETKGTIGETPMYFAVDSGARGCVELLLKRGAKVNAENSSGHSYLHVAVYGHNIAEAGNPDDQVAPPSSDPDNEAPVIADIQRSMPFSTEIGNRLAAIACYLAQRGCDIEYFTHTMESVESYCQGDGMWKLLQDYYRPVAQDCSARLLDIGSSCEKNVVSSEDTSAVLSHSSQNSSSSHGKSIAEVTTSPLKNILPQSTSEDQEAPFSLSHVKGKLLSSAMSPLKNIRPQSPTEEVVYRTTSNTLSDSVCHASSRSHDEEDASDQILPMPPPFGVERRSPSARSCSIEIPSRARKRCPPRKITLACRFMGTMEQQAKAKAATLAAELPGP